LKNVAQYCKRWDSLFVPLKDQVSKLPPSPGIYTLTADFQNKLDGPHQAVYIGKSNNVRRRLLSHAEDLVRDFLGPMPDLSGIERLLETERQELGLPLPRPIYSEPNGMPLIRKLAGQTRRTELLRISGLLFSQKPRLSNRMKAFVLEHGVGFKIELVHRFPDDASDEDLLRAARQWQNIYEQGGVLQLWTANSFKLE
jgi:hypothetical protein